MTTATVSQHVIQADSAAGLFEIKPFTPHCEVIRSAGDHAVIGVSPGNSYFSARRVHDLARWGLAHFERVDFFGGGRHHRPATALGRTHAQVALEVLLERMPGLRLAVPIGQLVWRTGFMKRIPERLPVMW